MNRTVQTRVLGLLTAGLLVFAVGCGGSSNKSSGSSSDTVASSESNGNGSSSNGSGNGITSGSCMTTALAWAALVIEPLGVMSGSSSADLAKMKADADELRSQVPSSIRDDFDVYVKAIQDFADALRGVDLTNILDPAVQTKIQKASDALDAPSVKKASDNIQAYFDHNCS